MTTKPFRPPSHLVVLETEDWVLNHRVDTVLPGYLMLGARSTANDLSDMPPRALNEFGHLLAKVQQALTSVLKPDNLYIGRYGHTAGHALHFHLIPICGWVRQSFFDDPRYRVLKRFSQPPSDPNIDETDGAELTLFVWREFCESSNPPSVYGPSIADVVAQLKVILSVHNA